MNAEEESTKKYSFNDWMSEADDITRQAVSDCFQNRSRGGWEENHITTEVLTALSELGTTLTWTDLNRKTTWAGYKLKGHSETRFGDIVVRIRVWLTDSDYIDGVAFYEAKRQFFKAGQAVGFHSMNEEQLVRITRETHASNVLLYDVFSRENQHIGFLNSLPTIIAENLEKNGVVTGHGRILYSYSENWVGKLGDNLRGLSLDFSPSAVSEMESAVNSDSDAPYFVLNADIALAGLTPKLKLVGSPLQKYEQFLGEGPVPDELEVANEAKKKRKNQTKN